MQNNYFYFNSIKDPYEKLIKPLLSRKHFIYILRAILTNRQILHHF